MTYERFKELFEELSTNDKVALHNEWCYEYGNADDCINDFEEEFFQTFFSSNDLMEICRATFFGHIESWNDEYIRFNAYGNLESLSEYEALGEIEESLYCIFEHEDIWKNYIEDENEE